MATDSNTCSICCEKFNKSNHAKTLCEYACGFDCCKECVRAYALSSSQEAHCMTCKGAYSYAWLTEKCGNAWVKSNYRDHRQEVIQERELSRLPESQVTAERKKTILELGEKEKELQRQIRELKKEKDRVRAERINIHNNGGSGNKRQFIQRCPNTECRGFLNTSYNCGMCKIHACPKCLEIIDPAQEHECNPETVETIKAIRSQSRPCPTCGERISKVSGCDQMWCPSCHTAFSWRTGQKENGVIHNPHLYEYLARQGNGDIPRNPGDQVCGGLPPYYAVLRISQRLGNVSFDERHQIAHIYTTMRHLIDGRMGGGYCLEDIRQKVRDLEDTEAYRVKYLLNTITKDELGKLAYKQECSRKENRDILEVLELLSYVGIEFFINFVEIGQGDRYGWIDSNINIRENIQNLDRVREVCNEALQKISVTWGHAVPQWDKNWLENKTKFTAKKLRAMREGKSK